jgi:hypothetical protein
VEPDAGPEPFAVPELGPRAADASPGVVGCTEVVEPVEPPPQIVAVGEGEGEERVGVILIQQPQLGHLVEPPQDAVAVALCDHIVSRL